MRLAFAALVALCLGSAASATETTLERTEAGGWRLLRGGRPFIVKGVGGGGRLDELKAAGGNTIRTWGVDENTGKLLDEAHRRGLAVIVGIWLGHPRHGFDYNDPDKVSAQLEAVRQAVEKHKGHPALLAWGLGNEMEGDGKSAALWSHIECAAALVRRLDAKHPTITILAEAGEEKIKNVHRLCPSVQMIGLNTYGGAPSVLERYRKAGGTRPVIITEFGPLGPWEVGKSAWGAPREQTSTEKAAFYEKSAKAFAADPLCLGALAFLWGHKMEQTHTWFGMFLPDGRKVASVDVMTRLWSGKAPADLCPTIEPLTVSAEEGKPGATVTATLKASDPEGRPLAAAWELRREQDRGGTGGDAEPETGIVEGAAVGDVSGAKVTLPKAPGAYRLYVTVTDPAGNAATANIPLLVQGDAIARESRTASKLPFTVYAEKSERAFFVPSGWMGDTKAITLDEGFTRAPHSGQSCIKITVARTESWGGVVWQHPAEDWGDRDGGTNLTGAKKLTFWAKGDFGGETVSFKFGLLGKDKKFPDTATGELTNIALTSLWKKYEIDLSGKDLTRIKTGFCFTVANTRKTITFYLDDIRYE